MAEMMFATCHTNHFLIYDLNLNPSHLIVSLNGTNEQQVNNTKIART